MIETAEQLNQWLPEVKASPWIALDTEADSLHAYPEKLCLLQFSLHTGDFLVDPLVGMDLAPLWDSLKGRELILHGADYDLRLLKRQHQFVPDKIFDTMIASRLLGCRSFGLADLVLKYLNVVLEKGPQKADWGKRPLSLRMEVYARNDTRYLKPLSDALKSDLQARGRLGWVEESCRQLIEDCSAAAGPDPDDVWRIKGSSLLNPRGLAVLRELWHHRDRLATRLNRPPFFVLSHESLIDLARAALSGELLEPFFPRRYTPSQREGFEAAIRRGLAVPDHELPAIRRSEQKRLSDEQRRRFEKLQAIRDRHAEQLGIDPTIIASKGVLIQLSAEPGSDESHLLPWQRALLS